MVGRSEMLTGQKHDNNPNFEAGNVPLGGDFRTLVRFGIIRRQLALVAWRFRRRIDVIYSVGDRRNVSPGTTYPTFPEHFG